MLARRSGPGTSPHRHRLTSKDTEQSKKNRMTQSVLGVLQTGPFLATGLLNFCFAFGKGAQQNLALLHVSHYERGLFAGGISRISKLPRISKFWLGSPLFSTVWGISRISKFPRISRKWTFLKRPLFPKDPFFRTRATYLNLA